MSLLGVDIGMSGTKAVIFSKSGKILGRGYREYGMIYIDQYHAELDPDVMWRAVVDATREAATSCPSDDPVAALSVSVSGDDMCPIDEEGNKLFNIISGYDVRGIEYGEVLNSIIGEKRFVELTGHSPRLMPQTIHRIMWIKENRPDIFEKTWKFACLEEFFFKRLGLEAISDYSVCARTLCFDIKKRQWSDEILRASGIPKEKLPDFKPAGVPIGVLPDATAKLLGLPSGVVCVTGGFDQCCAALGAGVHRPGITSLGLGTVICMATIFDWDALLSMAGQMDYPYCNYLVDDYLMALSMSFSGGSVLKWYRDEIGAEERMVAEKEGRNPYEVMASTAVDGPSRLLVLPHFEGAQNPWWDLKSKAAVLGLTLDVTRGEIIKALYEGIAFELRLNIERQEAMGVRIDSLRAIGGGSRSRAWLQTIADVTGKTVHTLEIDEGGCLACAILAGVAIGVYRDIPSAVEELVRVKETFSPRREHHELYTKRFNEAYKKLYELLKDINMALD